MSIDPAQESQTEESILSNLFPIHFSLLSLNDKQYKSSLKNLMRRGIASGELPHEVTTRYYCFIPDSPASSAIKFYTYKRADLLQYLQAKDFKVPKWSIVEEWLNFGVPIQNADAPHLPEDTPATESKYKDDGYKSRNIDFEQFIDKSPPEWYDMKKTTKKELHTKLINKNSTLWASGFDEWWDQQPFLKGIKGRKSKGL